MEFFDVINERQSIRKFKEKDIEEEKLKKILKAANAAPSAGNLQSYEIFLIKDLNKRKRLANASFGQSFVAEAPVVLVFFANPERARSYGKRRDFYSLQDATIATAHAHLASVALGLGSVWIGAFDDEEIKRICGTSLRPVALLPIGYPDEKPRRTGRRSLNDLVHEE